MSHKTHILPYSGEAEIGFDFYRHEIGFGQIEVVHLADLDLDASGVVEADHLKFVGSDLIDWDAQGDIAMVTFFDLGKIVVETSGQGIWSERAEENESTHTYHVDIETPQLALQLVNSAIVKATGMKMQELTGIPPLPQVMNPGFL